ncbi:MAG: hypothetical protein AAB582_03745 [Patescibacteria group bacterium]
MLVKVRVGLVTLGAIALVCGLVNLFAQDTAIRLISERSPAGVLLFCGTAIASILMLGDYLLLLVKSGHRWPVHGLVIGLCSIIVMLRYPVSAPPDLSVRSLIPLFAYGGMISTGLVMIWTGLTNRTVRRTA